MLVKGRVNYKNDRKDKHAGRQAGRLGKQTGMQIGGGRKAIKGKMAIKWARSVIR